eukprot:CAMPEP_0198155006 /NCGR_PEP_ID=MMETSP1443-20131203/68907_1 /TAXON_ID=186043 /ORGANISM="Entomoneis sp., Strain CCMP2396" /LENGTH=326 /DNA_ID=CAMNT_0043821731 /DNA_START=35 /DNA_END=1012 /DNA_ORIENTATION=+
MPPIKKGFKTAEAAKAANQGNTPTFQLANYVATICMFDKADASKKRNDDGTSDLALLAGDVKIKLAENQDDVNKLKKKEICAVLFGCYAVLATKNKHLKPALAKMLRDLKDEKPEDVVVSTVATASNVLPANVAKASLAVTPSIGPSTVAVVSALAIFCAQGGNHVSTDDDHVSTDDAYDQHSAEVSRLDKRQRRGRPKKRATLPSDSIQDNPSKKKKCGRVPKKSASTKLTSVPVKKTPDQLGRPCAVIVTESKHLKPALAKMLHDLINEKPENVVVSTVAVAPSALPANVSEASLAATPSLVHPTVAVASALAIFRAQDDNHAS